MFLSNCNSSRAWSSSRKRLLSADSRSVLFPPERESVLFRLLNTDRDCSARIAAKSQLYSLLSRRQTDQRHNKRSVNSESSQRLKPFLTSPTFLKEPIGRDPGNHKKQLTPTNISRDKLKTKTKGVKMSSNRSLAAIKTCVDRVGFLRPGNMKSESSGSETSSDSGRRRGGAIQATLSPDLLAVLDNQKIPSEEKTLAWLKSLPSLVVRKRYFVYNRH